MGYCSSWISRASFGMLRWLENGKSRLVIIDSVLLCDLSSPNNSCRNCRFYTKGGIHCCCYFPGWWHQDTLPSQTHLCWHLQRALRDIFSLFFQNSCGGGSPCTTHPCGTPNKPSGLTRGKKKRKEGSALYWVSFPFLKCFLWILGEELKSGEQLYQRRGRPGQGRVTRLLCGCEKPMKRKGWRKIFYLN